MKWLSNPFRGMCTKLSARTDRAHTRLLTRRSKVHGQVLVLRPAYTLPWCYTWEITSFPFVASRMTFFKFRMKCHGLNHHCNYLNFNYHCQILRAVQLHSSLLLSLTPYSSFISCRLRISRSCHLGFQSLRYQGRICYGLCWDGNPGTRLKEADKVESYLKKDFNDLETVRDLCQCISY